MSLKCSKNVLEKEIFCFLLRFFFNILAPLYENTLKGEELTNHKELVSS